MFRGALKGYPFFIQPVSCRDETFHQRDSLLRRPRDSGASGRPRAAAGRRDHGTAPASLPVSCRSAGSTGRNRSASPMCTDDTDSASSRSAIVRATRSTR